MYLQKGAPLYTPQNWAEFFQHIIFHYSMDGGGLSQVVKTVNKKH